MFALSPSRLSCFLGRVLEPRCCSASCVPRGWAVGDPAMVGMRTRSGSTCDHALLSLHLQTRPR